MEQAVHRYGRSTVSVLGNEQDLAAFAQVAGSLNIDLQRPPEIVLRNDAIFQPIRHNPDRKTAPLYNGGLFLSNGERDPAAPLKRAKDLFIESRIEPPPNLVRVEEPAVFLGWYFEHYGHMIIEGMARAYAVAGKTPGTRWLIGTPNQWPPRLQQNIDMFEYLGIKMEDVLDPNASYQIRDLLVPEPAFLPRHFVTDAFAGPFSAIAHAHRESSGASSSPVYLSRTQLTTMGFRLADEASLENLLAGFGFTIVHPQHLSLRQQINLMNSSTDFVGLMGSAFHNKIWALNPINTYMLCPNVNGNYLLFDAVKGGNAHYGHVIDTQESAEPGTWFRNRWIDLADWFESCGLVTPSQAGEIRSSAPASS